VTHTSLNENYSYKQHVQVPDSQMRSLTFGLPTGSALVLVAIFTSVRCSNDMNCNSIYFTEKLHVLGVNVPGNHFVC
jgi:hypothetical protein